MSPYLANALPAKALDEVAREIATDSAAPVDRAWLHLQLARCLVETGELERARAAAEVAVPIGQSVRHDPTASAITGTATAILFNTNPLGATGLGTVIESNDTAVGWWRTQTALRGAVALTETSFRRAIGGGDVFNEAAKANHELYAAASQAGFLGSQGQWRHYTGLLARQQLLDVDRRSGDKARAGLDLIRLAGDEKAAERATEWFLADGPALGVAEVTRGIDLERATSTTLFADLALLRVAGDVLDAETAERAAAWLVDAIENPARLKALSPARAFDTLAEVGRWLAGPVVALGCRGADLVVDAVERFGDDMGPLADIRWNELICAIPASMWTAPTASRLLAATPPNPEHIHRGIRAVSALYDVAAQDALVADVCRGDIASLAYLTDLSRIAKDKVDAMHRAVRQRVNRDLAAARCGELTQTVAVAPASLLVRLLLQCHNSESWHVFLALMADAAVPGGYKRDALRTLSFERDQLESQQRVELAGALDGVDGRPHAQDAPWRRTDISGELRFAQLVLGDHRDDAALAVGELAAAEPEQRGWAAALAGFVGDVGALTILVSDSHPAVRATAAHALTTLVVEGRGGPVAYSGAVRAAGDPGRTAALAVARALPNIATAEHIELRDALGLHPAASVRQIATASIET